MGAGILVAIDEEGVVAQLEARDFIEEGRATALTAPQQHGVILFDQSDHESQYLGIIGSGYPDLIVGYRIFFP
jgi:hypothetical protein